MKPRALADRHHDPADGSDTEKWPCSSHSTGSSAAGNRRLAKTPRTTGLADTRQCGTRLSSTLFKTVPVIKYGEATAGLVCGKAGLGCLCAAATPLPSSATKATRSREVAVMAATPRWERHPGPVSPYRPHSP